jgi:hypothetical protein
LGHEGHCRFPVAALWLREQEVPAIVNADCFPGRFELRQLTMGTMIVATRPPKI